MQEAFILSYNSLQENKEDLKKRWETIAEFGNPLEQYRAIQFTDQIDNIVLKSTVESDLILKTLDHIKVYEIDKIVVTFMDGSKNEYEGK